MKPLRACLAIALVTSGSCHRENSQIGQHSVGTDCSTAAPTFGPSNPWGDGSIPISTATGPTADATRATLAALRATIGFWRIAQDARTYCPSFRDLEQTPSIGFDPTAMRTDGWSREIEIECQGARVRLRSLGPDGVRDTADDVISP